MHNVILICLILGNHEMALKDKYEGTTVLDDKESYVAALLTNHLLSPLVHGPDYIIDKQYQDKVTYCPCWSRSCRKKINYGKTSIGKVTCSLIICIILGPLSCL